MNTITNANISDLIKELVASLGDDVDREGLAKTPKRVEKSLRYLTSGYSVKIDDVVNDAVFKDTTKEMIVVKNIDLFSLCEHHLLPFFGKCHVAYIPDGRIIGASKIPRIVDMYAKRFQIQERLTRQIAGTLVDVLKPRGVATVIEAQHLCMMMRGVEKQNSELVTSHMLGIFRQRPESRAEFLSFIKHNGR